MFAYGIDILPLIKNMISEFPDVTQPWYADDAGALVSTLLMELIDSEGIN